MHALIIQHDTIQNNVEWNNISTFMHIHAILLAVPMCMYVCNIIYTTVQDHHMHVYTRAHAVHTMHGYAVILYQSININGL